jgi:hypothetical protein
MTWGLTAGWLAVLGTALLTVGTGAQAWANIVEFISLRRSLQRDAVDALRDKVGSPLTLALILRGRDDPDSSSNLQSGSASSGPWC